MKLTNENYHSKEANKFYMSNSQYGKFMTCEALAMAELSGTYSSEESTALLQGKMLHAWNEGKLDEFIVNTPQLYKKVGKGLLQCYQDIIDLINFIKQDELIMFVLQGQKEVIFTAEMFGAHWKCCMDVYRPDKKRFGELKSTKSIRKLDWNDTFTEKISFIEQYNYPRQHAVYSEIERLANGRPKGEWFEGIMVAASKEDPPDKEVISLKDEGRVEAELQAIEMNMPRILLVKAGEAEPERCGRCAYCRSTKKLERIIHYSELNRRKSNA